MVLSNFPSLFTAAISFAQTNPESQRINVSGDAAVKVVPDRVTVMFRRGDSWQGSRSGQFSDRRGGPTLWTSLTMTSPTAGSLDYTTDKGIQVVLKDVAKFEPLLQAGLKVGANKVDGVEFSTSEFRKYRDQARAMAVKAAIEEAHDWAAAAGLRLADKPLNITSSSSGGGWWYGNGRRRAYGYFNAQNAVQNSTAGGGGGVEDSVALGKNSVSASVEMIFQIE